MSCFPSWPSKDPNEVLDFTIDWSDRLVADDTILTSTWTVPVGLVNQRVATTSVLATVWLGGGVLGTTYDVANQVVTAGGRTMDQTMRLKIRAQ